MSNHELAFAWRLQRRPRRGFGYPLGVPENLLFALFLPTSSAKKERKRGLGRSPKDAATTMLAFARSSNTSTLHGFNMDAWHAEPQQRGEQHISLYRADLSRRSGCHVQQHAVWSIRIVVLETKGRSRHRDACLSMATSTLFYVPPIQERKASCGSSGGGRSLRESWGAAVKTTNSSIS